MGGELGPIDPDGWAGPRKRAIDWDDLRLDAHTHANVRMELHEFHAPQMMAAAKPTGGRSLYIQNGEDKCV